MSKLKLPKAWEQVVDNQEFLPIIVKTLEKIHDSNWSMTTNKHDHFEMVYIKRGNAVFQVEGIDVNLGPNDIIIIKPFQTHKFIVKSENGCEFIVLSFKFRNNEEKGFADVSVNDFIEFVNNEHTGPFITIKLSKKNEIVMVMNRILREKEREQMWSEFLNYLLIMELFVLISRTLKREWEQNVRSRSLKLKELLHIAKAYMEENYDKELTLGDVSKYIFLSESYFAHTFKDEFGFSPKNYLLNVRIDASKELLANTDMKINDIALSVGFSSQQRYNDIFRKHTLITPLKYRRSEKLEMVNKIIG